MRPSQDRSAPAPGTCVARAGSRVHVAFVVLFVLLASVPARSQLSDPAVERLRPSSFNLSANGGRGLIQAVSPETIGSGQVAAGIQTMNFDRNPGDIDFFEYSVQVALGIGERVEVYFRASPWLRTTSVYQEPVRFPVPPLDLFVDTYPSTALRVGPYFMLSPEVPYKTYNVANRTVIGAHSRSSGDNVAGAKLNLMSQSRGDRAGVGVRGFVEFPTETPRYNVPYPEWRELAGVSGKIDFGFEALFSRYWKRTEILGNVGYKRIGDPDRGIRTQFVDSSQTDPSLFLVGEPVETRLNLPDELRLSVGLSLQAFEVNGQRWWAIAEFNHKHFVGTSIPVERYVHPSEVTLGLQTNIPKFNRVAIGAAWQLLLNDAGRGDTRTTTLRTPDGAKGDINFSPLVDPALADAVETFLADRGATFSPASSRVFSTNNPVFDAWRNIPPDPTLIRAEGGGNILGFVTFRLDGGP